MTGNSPAAPIFRSIFGDRWQQLPAVMRKHYANRPFTSDCVVAKGMMEVKLHWLVKLIAPLFAITKTLVPNAGSNVETSVHFISELHSNRYCLDRIFIFPNGKTYNFLSRMEPIGGNEVVEWTASGLGWRAAYTYENDRVKLQHLGYCIKLFGRRITLPLTALFGSANAEERALSESKFAMFMNIHHPLFGELYSYGGTFEILKVTIDGEDQP